MAAAGRGAPVAAAEATAGAHFAGIEGNFASLVVAVDLHRKKQANWDKRAAKKKRMQEQREELQRLKSVNEMDPSEGHPKKGRDKCKIKDQSGLQHAVRRCASRRWLQVPGQTSS